MRVERRGQPGAIVTMPDGAGRAQNASRVVTQALEGRAHKSTGDMRSGTAAALETPPRGIRGALTLHRLAQAGASGLAGDYTSPQAQTALLKASVLALRGMSKLMSDLAALDAGSGR